MREYAIVAAPADGVGPESRGSAGRKQTIRHHKKTLMLGWTRRQFVKGLSMAGSGCLAKYQSIAILPRLGSVIPAGFAQTALKRLFEEVPSATSGLTWRHENGRSPDYFLPERTAMPSEMLASPFCVWCTPGTPAAPVALFVATSIRALISSAN